MNVHTEVVDQCTSVTIVVRNRDELEKLINWVPLLRPLFPYPDPPADDPAPRIDMGSTAPQSTQETRPEPICNCFYKGNMGAHTDACSMSAQNREVTP